MVTTSTPTSTTTKPKYGTLAGATLFWKTLCPFRTVPASWKTNPPTHIVSADGVYTFEMGGYHPDGSGYGNIVFQEDPNTPQNSNQGGMLYVSWDHTGTTSGPVYPDPGAVTPTSPFDIFGSALDFMNWIGNLAIWKAEFWKRVGLGGLGLLIVVIAVVIIFRKQEASVARMVAK
jgi:hypothetical protein